MLLASPVGLLALALLAPSPQAAEPSPPDACETASPQLVLKAEPPETPPVVCISPDVPLTLRFDTALQPGSVRMEERERFADVSVGQRGVTLTPPEKLKAGERFLLEVCFADDAAPACASFLLLAHPALGLSQVKVFREPRPVASFQEGEKAARAEAQQCQQEVRQLRDERGAPEGLRGVLASGLMGERGIASKDLRGSYTEAPGNALRVHIAHSYRAEDRVAVEVWLENPSTLPWTAAGAVLRGPKGEVLKPLPLWQPEPVPPADAVAEEQKPLLRVVVEVAASEAEARGTYTLTLWDAEHKRTVTLGNITFP
ncbi:DUF2381 family protein [Archangium violaceum]|uniref:DUF2381 family protein n=1 Tax=Archangium violaceum Cb vi76 TaxID=1406225 RepID=A0A084SPJ0_9BACT|nr:DUF2381 family protein [Archangium violaceum]KFA90375.1 hypothetical protein Q664_29105 [Archangium violaceum Cb vi76]